MVLQKCCTTRNGTVYYLPSDSSAREWAPRTRSIRSQWARPLAWRSGYSLGDALMPAEQTATDSPSHVGHYVPDFAPKGQTAIYLLCPGATPDWIYGITNALAGLYDKDLPNPARHQASLE